MHILLHIPYLHVITNSLKINLIGSSTNPVSQVCRDNVLISCNLTPYYVHESEDIGLQVFQQLMVLKHALICDNHSLNKSLSVCCG